MAKKNDKENPKPMYTPETENKKQGENRKEGQAKNQAEKKETR